MDDVRYIKFENYSELNLLLDALYSQGYKFIDEKKHVAIDLYLMNIDHLIVNMNDKTIDYQKNDNKKITLNEMNEINQNILNRDKDSGFYNLDKERICSHPEHDPPKYLNIPKGKGYRHVCPLCSKVTNVEPLNITY